MLEYFITSKTKHKLLKLFLTDPEKQFYTREIAKLNDKPLNAVRRELSYLEKAAFVKSHTEWNLKYYAVVKEFPFYSELKRIIYSTVGLGDFLRGRLKDSTSIELAFIYGSVAKDMETSKSDIDLFVVGEIKDEELHRLVPNVEKEIDREINYTRMTKKEFAERSKRGESFLKRIEKEEKLVLRGDPDDCSKAS
jgi:predicted nucleotidyltransferase